MTGLVDQRFGQLKYGFNTSKKGEVEYPLLMAMYNQSLDRINSGIGINFAQQQLLSMNSTFIGGNYQYTFDINDSFKWSLGTALNYSTQTPRASYQDNAELINREYLRMNFGTAIKWKGLYAGINVGSLNLIKTDDPVPGYNPQPVFFNIHAWYDINISDRFILSPNIALPGNYFVGNVGLRGEHNNKVYWNIKYHYDNYFRVGGGIKVIDNLYMGYELGFNLNNSSYLNHNFSLTYRLRH